MHEAPPNKALQTDKGKLSRLVHSQESRQVAFAAEPSQAATMTDQLVRCVISMPELVFGNVAGKLCQLGAWLDDCDHSGDQFSLRARVPREG